MTSDMVQVERFRDTMHDDVLRSWAKDAQEELDRLRARVAEAEKDGERLDWLFNNPMEALDILGYHRIHELQFVRSEIDAAMEKANK